MKKYYFVVYSILISIQLTSCSSILFNKTSIIERNKASASGNLFKTDSLTIQTISVISRISNESPYRKFNRARLKNDTTDFKEIVAGIDALSKKSNFNINFNSDSIIKNDSLFKPLLNDMNFNIGFYYSQLDSLDFAEQAHGLHLIVTVIRETGCVPGYQVTCVYNISFIYDFFFVEGKAVIAHSTILRNRVASYPQSGKRWKPLPRDARRVFKKLYKVGKKNTS